MDNEIYAQQNVYRLKQLDLEAASYYCKIEVIRTTFEEQPSLAIYFRYISDELSVQRYKKQLKDIEK